MRYAHLYARLYHEPLALDAGTFHALDALLTNAMHGVLPAAQPDNARKTTPESRAKRADYHYDPGHGQNGRTALVHVDGVLDRHLAGWDAICFDGTDTADLEQALVAAERDRGTENILLAINSPGGSVSGIPELYARTRALAATKNVFAFVDGMAASGGYWLAAGADQILATPSSVIGSIGVYAAYLDRSRELADKGITVNAVQHGDLKTAGAPWKPMSDAERASIQARVDEVAAMFHADIRAARASVADDSMRGQVFYAATAKERGLIDGIVPDLAAALAEFP